MGHKLSVVLSNSEAMDNRNKQQVENTYDTCALLDSADSNIGNDNNNNSKNLPSDTKSADNEAEYSSINVSDLTKEIPTTSNSLDKSKNGELNIEKSGTKSLKYKLGKKINYRTFFPVKGGKKKKNHWTLKFNCSSLRGKKPNKVDARIDGESCVCTGYRKTDSNTLDKNDMSLVPLLDEQDDEDEESASVVAYKELSNGAKAGEMLVNVSSVNLSDIPDEDCDERARLQRAKEIAEGVDPPPGFNTKHRIEVLCNSNMSIDNLTALFKSAFSLSALSQIDTIRRVHTQIDYIHCLVPDLTQITACSFYWGKIDRYEAEKLLENKAEGTFLLRDSAQEDYLFSVSFRKYGRSLHARIEQWNHKFSFDSHDPGVFASSSVCGLIEHYKDPTCCMFFEPMLTIPLHRNFPFTLQHLSRAVICDNLTYDSINLLKLPKSLKFYLKEYHYKQRVRVRKFDTEH